MTGLKGVTESEAAKLIVEEAREQLQKDLGVVVTSWGTLKPGENNSLLNSSLRRRSNSISPSTSAHYSYLNRKNNTAGMKNKKAKKPTRKKVVKKNKSKVLKAKTTTKMSKSSFQIESSNVNKNSSFDFSAQMEELFESECETDDPILNKVPPNDEKTSNENKNRKENDDKVDSEISVKPKIPQHKKKRVSWKGLYENTDDDTILINVVQPSDEKTSVENVKQLSDITNKVDSEIFVKPKTPARNNKKRVSMEEESIVEKKCSPAKVPKMDHLEQEDPAAGNESENDLFGDSFIANFTQMEKDNNYGLAGNINQSCPQTPKYLVNSEKLEFIDSNNCTNTRAVINDDSTLSDTFLENAFETYMAQPETEQVQPETEQVQPEMELAQPETEQEIISESLLGAMETHMTTEPKTKESKAEPNENDKTIWILSKVTEIDASNTKSPKSQRLKDRKKRTHAENGKSFKL